MAKILLKSSWIKLKVSSDKSVANRHRPEPATKNKRKGKSYKC